ncbi:Vegetative incompatibility protein HET-E-1 [Beauveria bassiana]|nr:Vegetative incompatibility protein HET-E-1 [Beauveria bassiana]KAH8707818.1 Vegetative incompatibility protein HET-E-1 [Beauveria bassiana]
MSLCRFADPAICQAHRLISDFKAILYANDDSRYESLLNTTAGLVFLGTPFHGSKWQPLADALTLLMGPVGSHRGITRELGFDEPALRDRVHRFCGLCNRLSMKVTCFFELYETDYGRRLGIAGVVKGMVVEEASACILGLGRRALEKDHLKMNKYYGPTDPAFETVSDVISEMCRNSKAIPTDEGSTSADLGKCLQEMKVRNPEDILSDIKRQQGERVGHTCEWILERIEFSVWISKAESQLLRLIGSPGVGKTMMATFLVERLNMKIEKCPSKLFAYFFCDDKDEERRTPTAVLRSLIWQLLLQRNELYRHVWPNHEKEGRSRDFTMIFNDFSALWRIFRCMLRDTGADETFILVDALDECESSTRQDLLSSLAAFFQPISGEGPGKAKLLVTCRPDVDDIENELKSIGVPLRVDSTDINKDLSEYIAAKVDELSKKKGYTSKIKETVSDALAQQVGGTFLWVSLMVAELRRPEVRMLDLHAMLERLPRGLYNTYAAILDRVEPCNQNHAQFILRCMVATRRPLKKDEMKTAFATWKTGSIQCGEDLSVYDDILTVCSSILCVGSGNDPTLNFCHQSVKDFLLDERAEVRAWYHTTEEEANVHLFKACWAYLTAKEFNYGSLLVRREGGSMGRLRNASARELRDDFPQHLFLEYSSAEWENHAMASSTIQLRALAIEAAKAPTLRDAWLLRAAKEGNEAVVQLLLQHGAVMTADEDNMTPMHYAVSRSSKELAQCFLDASVHVDISVKRRIWQQLHRMTDESQDMPLLGDESQRGLTALHYSALTGCPQMTEFFLQHGANPNAASEFGETPLHLALKRDLAGARWPAFSDRWDDPTYRVEYILDLIEVDPDDEDDTEYCTTQKIIEEHRADVLTLLLGDGKTDVTARDDDGATALHSVRYGSSTSPDIVKQLIQRGADISARNNRGQTPLHLACFKGDAHSIITFLEYGADIGATDYGGVNCLHYAAESRNANTILWLLTAATTDYIDALPLVVSRDLNGRNALHHLLIGGKHVDDAAVQRLLELGVKCNELDIDGMSPLACYLDVFLRGANNAAEVVRLLFQGGSDAKFKTCTGGLNLAHLHAKSAAQVQVQILRELLRFEVDLQATDNDNRSILHHCAIHGSLTKEAFNFLRCEVELSLMGKDVHGKTAIDYVAAMKQKPRHPDVFDQGRWSRTEGILLSIM